MTTFEDTQKVWSAAEVEEALDRVISERGGHYCYPADDAGGCWYTFEDGTPGCIIGAIAEKIDPVLFEYLKEREAPTDDGNGAIRRSEAGSTFQLFRQGIMAAETQQLQDALDRLQRDQDTGYSWMEARARFIKAVRA